MATSADWEALTRRAEETLVERPKPRQMTLGGVPERLAVMTVVQPNAWIIAHVSDWPRGSGKTSDIRTAATTHRGPVLIHVATSKTGIVERLQRLVGRGLIGNGNPAPRLEDLEGQLGHVIARARIVGCRKVTLAEPSAWEQVGVFEKIDRDRDGRQKQKTLWAWDLEDVEQVEPFELAASAKGKSGSCWPAPEGLTIRPRERTT